MIIGVPKEIKTREFRVGLTPTSVRELTERGHRVVVETSAGIGAGFSDEEYESAGAGLAGDAAAVFERAQLIVKVKEPRESEWVRLTPDHTVFTYLHLAADRAQTEGLVASGCTAIAYETVTDGAGRLPLLAPMSEVAGRMSVQVGAYFLQQNAGGAGVLLGGVPGVPPAHVVVIGGGVSGLAAARMATGLGARVTILDKSLTRLQYLDDLYGGRIATRFSTADAIDDAISDAHLVIGAVLVPGSTAPKLIRRASLGHMIPGAVLVDIAIDQGGCFETSRPTTHDEPVFHVDGISHYCVTNMPGAVPRTSTMALNHATLPFVLALAEHGPAQAMARDPHLMNGLNIHAGQVTYRAVADAFGLDFATPNQALGRER